MNKRLIHLSILLLSLASAQAKAGVMWFDFFQGGHSEGATVTGKFAGADLDMDGALNSFLGEITAFSMTFSGNSIVPGFNLGISDLGGLVYVLGTPLLGDDMILGAEGLAAGPFLVLPGPSPTRAVWGRRVLRGDTCSSTTVQGRRIRPRR